MPTATLLRAGPIQVKYADGELRYLRAGGREILRRVYFAVRDALWDTAVPAPAAEVQADARSFRVTLDAECRNPRAHYRWHGEIIGTAEGEITVTVRGAAPADFASPRIGLCLLFGAPALTGRPYEVIAADGRVTPGVFPDLVEPALLQPLNSFQSLRYTVGGLRVETSLRGGAFGMEDQRNYGDASYKAMSGMPYDYPHIRAGEAHAQTVTLRVTGAPAANDEADTARITLGAPLAARLPKLVPSTAEANFANLTARHWDPARVPAAHPLVLPYSPGLHLFDDDTYLENIPTVVDWARTLRAARPGAPIRLDPVTLNPPYPRPGDDPRVRAPFAAAWSARLMKFAALAGIEEVAFAFDHPLHARLAACAGAPLLATAATETVDALAIRDGETPRAWLINRTDEPRQVEFAGQWHVLAGYEVAEVTDP